MSFDGDDYVRATPDPVETSGPLNAPNAVTVACWVKFNILTVRQKMIYKGATNAVNYSLGKNEYENKFEFLFTRAEPTGPTNTSLISSSTIVAGRWYHVAATYDGSAAKLYIDGVENASENYPGGVIGLVTTTEELRLGWLNWSDYLNGVLDEPQVYDRVLTLAEVKQLARVIPVGEWTLDEGSGGVAFDRAGTGILGTLHGPSWVPGKFGNGLGFRGTAANDYVELATTDTLDIPETVTVMAWVKFNTLDGGRQKIIYKGNNIQTRVNYSLGKYEWSETAEFLFTTGSGTVRRVTSSTVLSPDVWYHMAGTYDGTTATLYINGTVDATVSASGDLDTVSGAPLNFGRLYDGADYLAGTMDEPQVFAHALSSDEVKRFAQAQNVQSSSVQEGEIDDSARIQRALDQVALDPDADDGSGNGKILVIPAGRYVVNSTLNVRNGSIIDGRSSLTDRARFVATTGTQNGADMLAAAQTLEEDGNITIRNLELDGGNSAFEYGLTVYAHSKNVRVEGLYTHGFRKDGANIHCIIPDGKDCVGVPSSIVLRDTTSTANGRHGIGITQGIHLLLDGVLLSNNDAMGIDFEPESTYTYPIGLNKLADVRLTNVTATGNDTFGVAINDTHNIKVDEFFASDNGAAGIAFGLNGRKPDPDAPDPDAIVEGTTCSAKGIVGIGNGYGNAFGGNSRAGVVLENRGHINCQPFTMTSFYLRSNVRGIRVGADSGSDSPVPKAPRGFMIKDGVCEKSGWEGIWLRMKEDDGVVSHVESVQLLNNGLTTRSYGMMIVSQSSPSQALELKGITSSGPPQLGACEITVADGADKAHIHGCNP